MTIIIRYIQKLKLNSKADLFYKKIYSYRKLMYNIIIMQSNLQNLEDLIVSYTLLSVF